VEVIYHCRLLLIFYQLIMQITTVIMVTVISGRSLWWSYDSSKVIDAMNHGIPAIPETN